MPPTQIQPFSDRSRREFRAVVHHEEAMAGDDDGLFVGSVVLVLGYTLFMAWLDIQQDTAEPGTEPDVG
jgi:hypothetical protein